MQSLAAPFTYICKFRVHNILGRYPTTPEDTVGRQTHIFEEQRSLIRVMSTTRVFKIVGADVARPR